MDAPRIHTGTDDRLLVSGSHLPLERRVLSTLLLLALVSLSGIMPAAVAKESNNTCEEIQILRGIPDTIAFMGKVFYYPVPPFAFQGKITQYKITLANGADLPKWLEFNPNTSTLQGLPVNEETGEYHLNVAAHKDGCVQKTPRANVNFTLHVQDSILIPEKTTGLSHMPKGNIISSERCSRDSSLTSAEIIIHAAAESLDVQQRLFLVCTMAEYLHLDPTSLALNPYQGLIHRSRRNLTILAEDIRHVSFMESHYIGLYWPVGCGVFAMLYELIQVLRHNVDSHHLSQLLGYEIAGWRIIKREGFERKRSGRQRRQLRVTPTPTLKMTEMMVKPTGDDVFTTLPPNSLIYLHTDTVVSPIQTWFSFHKASTTVTSYIDLMPLFVTSQGSLEALEMGPSQNFLSKRPMSRTIFQDLSAFAFPELSPSLIITETSLSREFKGLQNTVSSMPLLLEQPQSHVQELDAFLLSGKSEPSRHHFLSVLSFDITEPNGKGQFSRPIHTLMTETHYEWPLTSPEVSLVKTAPQTHFPEEILMTSVYSRQEDGIFGYPHFPEFGIPSNAIISPEKLLSTSISTSVQLTTLFGFTPPTDDMFLLLSGGSHLSQELFNGYEYMSNSFMTIPQTDRLPFTEEETSVPSIIHMDTLIWDRESKLSYVTSILDYSILSSTFPSDSGLSHETNLTAQSYPDNAPLLTLLTDFAGFDSSELSRPTKIFTSYDSSKLRIQNHFPSALPSDTKDLNSDKSLGTKMILPNVTVFTLELTKMSNIPSYTAEISVRTIFNATSHLYNNAHELVQMSSSLVYQDTSSLPFPTYESLQSTHVPWVRPLFSVSQVPQDITPATIGCKFHFSVPADTFYDQEDGNSTQLTLGINPVDGSPSGPESWLQFNASLQAMYGYPLSTDFQYSPQEFVLSATDSGGLTVWEPLIIELLRPTSIPCHIYTIRTKNSYHSFLRERERVGLFLDKLSKYLNSSSLKSITLTALRPGSTVISWYNRSLCTSSNRSLSWCSRDEIQEVLNKLRVPDGNVSPYFAEAMLPEYKIDIIENVSYGGICLPTTKPFNGSCTLNSTFPTYNEESNSWIRNVLLISLCATIMVALIIVAHHCCKYHKKILESQSMTFQGRPLFDYVDLEMDMLKPRKAPVPQREVPPSPHLWIPVPPSSQQQPCRPNVTFVASRLPQSLPPFQPPKYQLPPHYKVDITSHSDQGNSHRRDYPKSGLY
ncbi:hypothetical protein KIL84_018090 [Mauremys mutica]|uniref:Dystroglycan 1 n=1 Tax=Mauremys mutica TaxID=74926 RepID=A0A9D4B940_9SAUR|nr:hypothetical protein KIL84_018090 [Mauremys mutica]